MNLFLLFSHSILNEGNNIWLHLLPVKDSGLFFSLKSISMLIPSLLVIIACITRTLPNWGIMFSRSPWKKLANFLDCFFYSKKSDFLYWGWKFFWFINLLTIYIFQIGASLENCSYIQAGGPFWLHSELNNRTYQ